MITILVVILLYGPGTAAAQSGQIAHSRHEARSEAESSDSESVNEAPTVDDVDPLDSGWIRRFFARVEYRDQASELVEFHGFQPVFGGLQSGAGFTAGLKYEPLKQGSALYFSTAVRGSARGYWGTEALLGVEADPFVAYGFARYHHMPQEDFYGIGPNTPVTQHASFRQDELFVGGLAGYHPGGDLFVGVHASFLENRIGPGTEADLPVVTEAFTPKEAPGRFPGVSYVVSGVWIEYDTRALPPLRAYGSRFSPTQPRLHGLSLDARHGILASVEVRNYMDFDGGNYGFSRLMVESQQYLSWSRRSPTLALRQYASLSRPSVDEVVPFYMMQPLGGVRSLRGFGNDRFRDLNAMLLNAEVRVQVLSPVQLAVFADAGHVFRRFDEINTNDLEASYGAGLRLRLGGMTLIRLEVAHSREGFTTYVNLGAFL